MGCLAAACQSAHLLELFCRQAFGFRDYRTRGLVGLLDVALFDRVIVRKFIADRYDVDSYAAAVRNLTRKSNSLAMDALSMAHGFMSERTYDEVAEHWPLLEHFARREHAYQLSLVPTLREVLSRHDLDLSLFES